MAGTVSLSSPVILKKIYTKKENTIGRKCGARTTDVSPAEHRLREDAKQANVRT